MVIAPILAFLSHPVVHDQDAVTVYAMDDGFGDGRSRLQTVHARDAFQGFTQRKPAHFLQGLAAQGIGDDDVELGFLQP